MGNTDFIFIRTLVSFQVEGLVIIFHNKNESVASDTFNNSDFINRNNPKQVLSERAQN